MSQVFTRIVVTAFSIVLVAEFVPGIKVDSVIAALGAAIVIGILNTLVRPVLIILTLPITIVTLGLFLFVVNAFLFWLAATWIPGFTVAGFIPALIGSCIVSLVSVFVNKKIKD